MEQLNYSSNLFWEDQGLDFNGPGLPAMFTLKEQRERRRQKDHVPDDELLVVDCKFMNDV